MQQLADRTAELGMPIPRSVLANLESGRRDTVSVAEVLVLAAALDVAPIELICPVGFDKQTEMLPGCHDGSALCDALVHGRAETGRRRRRGLDRCGCPVLGTREQSNIYLVKYHDQLISRLDSEEAKAREALRAVADAVGEEADEQRSRAARVTG